MKPTKLGFLASGRGTNMQAIIDACNSGRLDAEPVVVISNNADALALNRADREHIPAFHLGARLFTDPDELDQRIAETLMQHGAELVILAGYMKKLGPRTLAAYAGRVINVHPALLPKFGGRGMYGDNIHRAVLAAGEPETGVTIHVVEEKYDSGPVLAQRKVKVEPGDTVQTLGARVLAVEHELFVETIGAVLQGKIKLPNNVLRSTFSD
jgi:phosphoribosylglycinamide formyltransferase-1